MSKLCTSPPFPLEGDDSQRDPDFEPAGARVQVNLDEEVDQLVDDDEELVPVTCELFLPNLFDSANISLATPARTRRAQPRNPLFHGSSHSQCLANRGVHHGECRLCWTMIAEKSINRPLGQMQLLPPSPAPNSGRTVSPAAGSASQISSALLACPVLAPITLVLSIVDFLQTLLPLLNCRWSPNANTIRQTSPN